MIFQKDDETGKAHRNGETPWHIDRLNRSDASRLQRLAWRCYPPYYADLWHEGAMANYLDDAFAVPLLEQELMDDNVIYEIAHADTEDLGFLKWHRRADSDGCVNAAYLERVYISPAAIGTGLGSALIERAIAGASAEGRAWIWLRAMADLPKVLARYESAGFEAYARSAITTAGIRSERAAMVVMRRALT